MINFDMYYLFFLLNSQYQNIFLYIIYYMYINISHLI